jgi:RHS repeat-associated protein
MGTALIRKAPQVSGTVEGSIHLMTGEQVVMDGGSTVTGTLLVPGTPSVHRNGRPDLGGIADGTGSSNPASYGVVLKGNCRLGWLQRRTEPIAIPAFEAIPTPAGTRDLAVERPGQNLEPWATVRNLTLHGNAGVYAIPPGTYGDWNISSGAGIRLGFAGATEPAIYNISSLTLGGRANLIITGPVVLNIAGGLVTNGTSGTWSNPAWLVINSAGGLVQLNGGSSVYGYVNAPSADVIIAGGAELSGGVVCDRLIVHGRGLVRLWKRSGGAPNQPPVATAQQVAMLEDAVAEITLSAQDPENGTLEFRVTREPVHGSLAISGASVIYTPARNYFGSDVFAFVASDGIAESEEAEVSLEIAPVNDLPIPRFQPVVMSEDDETFVTLEADDVDGDPLTYAVLQQPSSGVLELNEPQQSMGRTYRYRPAADFSGDDCFRFVASDGQGQSVPGTVSIKILPINDVPTAENLSFSVPEDEQLTIVLSGRDIDGDPLSFTVASPPLEGVITNGAGAGILLYQPRTDFWGADGLEYVVSDGSADSPPATVSINVIGVNDAPEAVGQDLDAVEDMSVTIDLTGTDPDGDALTYVIDQQPLAGVVTPVEGSANRYLYTPATDSFGRDSFAFRVDDGSLSSAPAVIYLDVAPVNDPPAALGQTVHVEEDGTATIVLVGADPDGDALAYFLETVEPNLGAVHGTLRIAEAGLPTLVYTPFPDYAGPDSFAFRVNDGAVDSAPATVEIVVAPRNDAPTIHAGPDLTLEQPGIGFLTANIQDIDGTPGGEARTVRWELLDGPDNVTLAQPGSAGTSARFPVAGTYHLRVTVDDAGLIAADDVIVTVKPRNVAPSIEAGADRVVSFGEGATLFATASDDGLPGTQPLRVTWRLETGPGVVTFSPNGNDANVQVTFSAPGEYVLRATANDGLLSASDSLKVSVQRPNQPPVVSAGFDLTAPLSTPLEIVAAVSDDGLPNTAALTVSWEMVSGPGRVDFKDLTSAQTTAHFSEAGQYVLRVTASDSVLSTSDILGVLIQSRQNEAPKVNAGIDRELIGVRRITLEGFVQDDGSPNGSTLFINWQQIEGPDGAEIHSPHLSSTGVVLPGSGTYRFRLAASDSELAASDEVVIVVRNDNEAPVVNAGADQSIRGALSATLRGSVTDDGVPTGSGITFAWSQVSGPGQAVLSNSSAATITVTVENPGVYEFRLSATDSLDEGSDTAAISFIGLNEPPVVDAGPDQSVPHISDIGENLIQNGSNESPVEGSQIVGWIPKSGSWLTVTSGTVGVPTPHEGSRYLAPGANTQCELCQDVDLTPMADAIDAGGQILVLKAFVRSKAHVLPDTAKVVLEYRDVTNSQILRQRTLAPTASSESWLLIADAQIVPVGTRTARVRLIATPSFADGTNDVYFDAVSLSRETRSSVQLRGLVSDDGLPEGAKLKWAWTQVAGPSEATLMDPTQLETDVSLNAAGTYVFELSASDSSEQSTDRVMVHVIPAESNLPPVVNAGEDVSITLPEDSVELRGTAQDDAGETNSELTYSWIKLSGDGEVHFSSVSTLQSNVRFSEAGTYVLRLTADDGEFVTHDDLTVTVDCPEAPIPMDLAIVIDQSDSMTGSIGSAKLAARLLVDRMSPLYDLGCVIAFNTGATVLSPLSPNFDALHQAIQSIGLSGGTSISEGLRVARGELALRGRSGKAKPVIVLLTDGQSSFSAAVAQADAARAEGVRVIPIGLGNGVDHNLLSRIASAPTDYHFAAEPSSLDDIYLAISDSICRYGDNHLQIHAGIAPPDVQPQSPIQLNGRIDVFSVSPDAVVTTHWSRASGPGEVAFSNASTPVTTASFNSPGTYVLSLRAEVTVDGRVTSGEDLLVVRVEAPCVVAADSSLVALWRGDGDAMDEVSGIILEGNPRYAGSKVGVGMNFVPSDVRGGLKAPASQSLDIGASEAGLTIEWWMKPRVAFMANRPVIEWNSGSTAGLSIWQANSNRNRFDINLTDKSGNAHWTTSGDFVITENEWQHFAVVYDRVKGSVKFYRNGDLLRTTVVGSFVPQTEFDLHLGSRSGALGYDGILDEVSLYNRPLGTSEISGIYHAGEVGKCSPHGNSLPVVHAGEDQGIESEVEIAELDGMVQDDGTPAEGRLRLRWSKVHGPGDVSFADEAAAKTAVSFSQAGIYVLELEASDGTASASDRLTVRVGTQCEVESASGLVAWWSMNGDGDDSLGRISLQPLGKIQFGQGKSSMALSLNGTTAGVQAPYSSALDVGESSTGFTVEWWMNPRLASMANRPVIEWNDGGKVGVSIWQANSNVNRFDFHLTDKNGGAHWLPSPNYVINQNEWQHYALVYDRLSGRLKFYRNGDLLQDAAIGSFVPQTGYDLFLGYRQGAFSYDGLLDEVSLYNRPLSASEISGVFRAGETGKCPVSDNLPPLVSAGSDQSIETISQSAMLDGFVEDDGLPAGQQLQLQWRKIGGPGEVSFSDGLAAETRAEFTLPGLYVLELVGSDGFKRARDQVTVRVGADCAAAAPTGLSACWPFDGNGEDLLGQNNVQLLGATSYGQGRSALGLRVDGVRAGARVPRSEAIDIGASVNGFTIEWWMNPRVVYLANRPVLEWNSGTNVGVSIWQANSSRNRFDFHVTGKDGVPHHVSSPEFVLSQNEWQHFALAYDRTAGRLRFYKNGTLLQDVVIGSFAAQTGYDLFLGYRGGSASFDGDLDELGLYTRSLSSAEIQTIALAGERGKCAPEVNRAPLVSAGSAIVRIGPGQVTLVGVVKDDGLPVEGQLHYHWSQTSGPAEATIFNHDSLSTAVTLPMHGVYTFELSASDSERIGRSTVTAVVTVAQNQAPIVSVVSADRVPVNGRLILHGSGSDDGIPAGSSLQFEWAKVSGPGFVTFESGNIADTAVRFSEEGIYRLRLTATDSELSGQCEITIAVDPPANQRPMISAGPDVVVPFGSPAVLNPEIFDDGMPDGYVTVGWEVMSGSGSVTLSRDPSGDTVTAGFGRVGSYVIRLLVSDGEFDVHDDVTITVTAGSRPGPQVELLAPAEGQKLVAGERFTLLAQASSEVGSIESVEFFVNGSRIGESAMPPYGGPWIPTEGRHTVTAVATDNVGVTAPFGPVSVTAQLTPPGIRLVSPLDGSGFRNGSAVTLSAQIVGNPVVEKVEFRSGELVVGEALEAPFRAEWQGVPRGQHTLTAVLFMADGQTIASAPAVIRLLDDPGSGSGLELEIRTPSLGATVTAPTAFTGTVKSPILRSWRIEHRKKGDSESGWTTFGAGTTAVTQGVLGELDTSLLKNGIHEVRLVATDAFGRSYANDTSVLLDGEMKIGHFTAAFQDLQIPLSGIPISIMRIYDSRDRMRSGDFGFGWSLDVSAIRLERDARLGEGWVGTVPESSGLSLIAPYSMDEDQSHAVAITMPDGGVERFRVRWRLVDRVKLDVNDIASTYYGLPYTDPADLEHLTPEQKEAYYALLWSEHQRDLEELRAVLDLVNDEGTQLQAPPPAHARMQLIFEPLPGTHGTLEPKGVPQYLYRADTWGGAMELATEPEPDLVNNPGALFTDASGWTYTSQDGRKFEFNGEGKLERIQDLQSNSLTITANGVFHSSGQAIIFHRDDSGRIDTITDPAGNALRYAYNVAGDLSAFHDRTKDPAVDQPSTRFNYAPGLHYLTDIFDARGVKAAKNFFDDNGRLFKIADAAGKETVFGHEIGSRTETITDRTGEITRHRYDERGNITRTESPDGTVTVSGYHRWSDGTLSNLKTSEAVSGLFTNDAGELVQQTVSTHYAYEDDDAGTPLKNDGLLRKLVDPLGNTTRFEYDIRGNVLQVLGPGGDCCGSDSGNLTINTYYPGTNLLHTSTDALGNVTVQTYDIRGNPDKETRTVTVVDAAGASSMKTLVTDSDYDRFGRLERMTDLQGHVTSYERDPLGNVRFERTTRSLGDGTAVAVVTEHAYDAEGRLTKTWDAEHLREDGSEPTSETIYDARGKPWKTFDALRNVTESAYNARGELETVIYADGSSEDTLYDAEGRREFSTDRRGKTTQFVYDSVGRLQETWWLGSAGDVAVRINASVYDAAGRVVDSVNARGYATRNVYDAAGRRRATINAKAERTDFEYDSAGNLRFVTDVKGRATEHVYDALNRRIRTIFPAAEIWTGSGLERTATETVTAYDKLGRRIAEYEQSPVDQPTGTRRLTRFVYDAMGRLEAVVDPLGQVTSYDYDELGNQLTQTDARGHTTEYVYDNVGRRKQRILPGGQSESQEYDAAGRMRFRTDFNGETTELRYDSMGRLRFRIPATRPQEQVEWRYSASGQREWMIEANGRTTQYHYDARDRLHWKATPEGTITYSHDDAGHVTSIKSSTTEGAKAIYGYDELDRLETVTDANQQQTGYLYDGVGNLEHVRLPNGITSSYAYDENNRLRSLGHQSLTHSAAALARYQYQVYATGRRRSATDSGAVLGSGQTSRVSTYGYDALWRLKSETVTGDPQGRNGTVNYGYDAVGNRENRSSSIAGLGNQAFGFDANDRMNGDIYDANGNTRVGAVSQAGGTASVVEPNSPAPILGSDTYDGQDRLVSRTSTTGSVQIVYDGDGHKVRETVVRGGVPVTTTYLIDELNPTGYAQVLEEKISPAADGAGGTLSRVYTYGHDLLSQDQYVGTPDDGDWHLSYFGYDGHGNVRFLTDVSGQITDTYTYDAFGTLVSATGSTENRYLYCGEQYDSALGLYYLRARLMNPLTGRFWTADTYEGQNSDPQSIHKYLYVHSDPLNGIDPSGRSRISEIVTTLAVRAHVTVSTYVARKPVFAAITGLSIGILIPDELDFALQQSGFPGLQSLSALRRGELRLFRLLRSPWIKSFVKTRAREAGLYWNRLGGTFEEFLANNLFLGARRKVPTGANRDIDFDWRDYIVEAKTSTSLSKDELEQLKQAADAARRTGKQLIYFFLEEPTPSTVEKIKAHGGSVVHFFPNE